MATQIISGLLVLAILVVVIRIYNQLVTLKHAVAAAWSNIDVMLKQRHDELPKLVDACKVYMQYERETLEGVMRARNSVLAASTSGNLNSLGTAEGELRATLGRLYAVAENYPQLKADGSFAQLQSRISGLETGITDRRELYNDAVNVNNASIEQFPATIVAGMFGFKPAQLLVFQQFELANPDVKALFA